MSKGFANKVLPFWADSSKGVIPMSSSMRANIAFHWCYGFDVEIPERWNTEENGCEFCVSELLHYISNASPKHPLRNRKDIKALFDAKHPLLPCSAKELENIFKI